MKNNATRTIRSEEITIDVRICAALAANRGGEVYLAAIAPDMELTVITLDEALANADSPTNLSWLINNSEISSNSQSETLRVEKLVGEEQRAVPAVRSWRAPCAAHSPSRERWMPCTSM